MPAAVIEAMLLRWADNQNGRTVTLLLPGEGEHPFRGLKCGPANGQRLGLAVALIGDDEKPEVLEAKPEKERRPFHTLPRSQQAALLCDQPKFWRFINDALGHRIPDQGLIASAQLAANAVRFFLAVQSRADLDADKAAGERWDVLYAQFKAWETAPRVGG